MRYKVGDKVLLVSKRPFGWTSLGGMDKFLGKTVKIREISKGLPQLDSTNFSFENDDDWSFTLGNIEQKIDNTIKLYKHLLNEKI